MSSYPIGSIGRAWKADRMDFKVFARSLPESTVMDVHEIGQRCPVPVLVEVTPIDAESQTQNGRKYGLVFDNSRRHGRFGLAEFRIIAEDGGAQLGSMDAREARLGELSRTALRYLAMSWPHGFGTWVTGSLTVADWSEAHKAGGANEVDSDVLPPMAVGTDGQLGAAPKHVIREFRKLGPSDPKTAKAVAAIYRYAERNDLAPNAHVALVLDLSRSTASHWIKLSREAGELPPSVRKPRTNQETNRGND